jgi:hypothetical protein
MNSEYPKPKPERGKVPPIPPIAVGAGFLGEEGNQDYFALAAEYANSDFVDDITMAQKIDEKIIDMYEAQFINIAPIAFCLICGEVKNGPWSKCSNCYFKPQTLEDLAKHYATTAFNPKIKNSPRQNRLQLAQKCIEQNLNLVNSLASGMFKKMKPVLEQA